MDEKEVVKKLLEFDDVLSYGSAIQNIFRSIIWVFVKGLAWIVDKLENMTDQIMGLQAFYRDPAFVDFVDTWKPLLVIILALNLLYTGYLLIFQKSFNREGLIINFVIAMFIVITLGAGMQEVDKFTTQGVNVVNEYDGGTMSSSIIRDNLTDITLYDDNSWENKKLEDQNNIKPEYVTDININSRITEKTKDPDGDKLSKSGQEIVQNKVETLGDGSHKLIELEDGSFFTDITKESYYRYTVDWFTMIVTLAIIAFVLVTVGVKLAKLFFELAFNYLLAILIAPADIHNGQKTKQVIQNIINILLVTVMIFMSMKVYLIGTQFIDNHFHGILYLVAMLGFAMAVIDGPNIVERLFGIDAGLKSGWGAIAGTYAIAKGASSAGKSMAKGAGTVGKGMAKGANAYSKGIGSKGMSPSAGVAGQKATNSSMNKDKNNEGLQQRNSNNPNKKGASQNNQLANKGSEKENGSAKEQASATKEPSQNSQFSNENRQNDSGSSLDQEMKESQSSGSGSLSGKRQSLHDEMKKKGYDSQGIQGNNQQQNSNSKGVGPTSLSTSNSGTSTAGVEGITVNSAGGSQAPSTGSSLTQNTGRGSISHGGGSQAPNMGSAPTPSTGNAPTRGRSTTRTETTQETSYESSPSNEGHIQQEKNNSEHVIRNNKKERIVEDRSSQRSNRIYQIGKAGRKTEATMKKDITKNIRGNRRT